MALPILIELLEGCCSDAAAVVVVLDENIDAVLCVVEVGYVGLVDGVERPPVDMVDVDIGGGGGGGGGGGDADAELVGTLLGLEGNEDDGIV